MRKAKSIAERYSFRGDRARCFAYSQDYHDFVLLV